MSSKYTTTNLSKYSRKISFMRVIKVAGALVRPKGRTRNSKCPYLVLKAVLGISSSLIRI
jgi:hypothetical protein